MENISVSHSSNLNDVSPPQEYNLSKTLTEDDIKGHDFTIDEANLPPGYFRSARFIGSMLAIGVSFGCGVAGFAFAAPILGVINADLGPSTDVVWVALSYTLTSAVFLMITGRLTDLFGRRWFMIGGNVLGLLGSIVCATAKDINALIAGETLIGLGASAQLCFAFTINELVPFKYRQLGNAYCYLWGIFSSAVAPIISYAFVVKTSVGWRGVFYLLIALNAIGLLCWIFFYFPPDFHMKHGRASKMKYIKNFDYIGTVLATAGLLLFLMGLSWGGSLYAWKSAHVISTIVVGFMLLVAFGFYEAYVPMKEPLLPVHLFKNKGLIISILIWSLGASVYYAFAIVWPSMVVTVYAPNHKDPMWPGYAACALNGGISLGEILGAFYNRRTNWQIRFVFAAASACLAATASCTPDTETRAIVLMFFGALLIGYNEILNSVVATICVVDQREIGTAIGFGGSSRSFVSTVCATIYSVILSNRLKTTIPAIVPPALLKAGLPASSITDYFASLTTGNFTDVPGISPTILAAGGRAYQEANVAAYKTVFLSTLAVSGLGMILTIFAPNIDHLLTGEVTTTLHEKSGVIIGDRDATGEAKV